MGFSILFVTVCLIKFYSSQKSQTDVFGEMNKDLLNEMQNLKNEIDTIDNLLRKYVNT